MKLGEMKFPKGARKRVKRVGRGEPSGHGKTSCRGNKGQKSRSGVSIKGGFEGGQMPLYRRLPKFGFKNPFRVEYDIINVSALEAFDDGASVGPEQLKERGLVPNRSEHVKVLGEGELKRKLTVRAHKFSKTAEEKIRGAGGTIEVI